MLSARPPLAVPSFLVLAVLLGAAPALALGPEHRLDHVVVPTAETLRLDLDAGKPGYTGSARIALKVATATDSFQFHALDLKLEKVTLRGKAGPVALKWS